MVAIAFLTLCEHVRAAGARNHRKKLFTTPLVSLELLYNGKNDPFLAQNGMFEGHFAAFVPPIALYQCSVDWRTGL